MTPTSHFTSLHADPYPADAADQVQKPVVFFDIDNCLYSVHCGIAEEMATLIQQYFEKLGLSTQEARHLHSHYYKEYGLSIRGLVKHHQVDPEDYNKNCDAALPLEKLLAPDQKTIALLSSIDRRKARLFALTNAQRDHALRVLKILQLDHLFEGVISCDYSAVNFCAKPEIEMYREAEAHVGVAAEAPKYFVDDSNLNIRGAKAAGWQSVWFKEQGEPPAEREGDMDIVDDLEQLRRLWPDVFT